MRFVSALLMLLFISLTVHATSGIPSDTNKDGKPDQWEEMDGEGNTIFHFDRDFDGSIDYRVKLNETGNKISEELDYNYDGTMDDFYFYENGVLRTREVDTNFDAVIDLWVFIKEGIYVEKFKRDTDFDGEVDIVKSFGS